MLTCPSCGRQNPEDSAFCNSCGAALAATPAREVRKTVTVLFCDVAGSTAMGERLDPESLRRVMDRYFQAMRAPIERNGGSVEKFIGDAVMAVFGIPRVHEDDALRAVRAAAEMQRALEDLNKGLERDHGVSISNRIGVNTGEVVTSDPAGGDRLVTGDAVNTAARLEQAAGTDDTLLGETTYRLVRDAVEAEPAEAVVAKGKTEPVPAWRLIAVLEGVEGVARRRDAPMVGREGELRLLSEARDRAVREGTCVLVTILGPAGVGKSRLVDEFLSGSLETTALRGRCLPYGDGITFWPIVEMLTWAAGLSEIDPRETVLAKLKAVVEPSPDADTITQRLAHLLGLEGAQADPEETFWAVRKTFEALASRGPLVVDLDDLHWAEPSLLDLVEHVADWSRGAPIVLLCSARPEFLDDRPAWGGGKMNATSFLLEPLPGPETERLAHELLADAPASLVERVVTASEGNPLFVEQMAAMIVEDGPRSDDAELAVPPTIQALLGARLDRLDEDERAVIERASIEGKVFHRAGVLALCDDELRAAADRHLRSLMRRDLVRPVAAPDLAGEDAFRFRHQLIRDAAYSSIPKETRAELHARFADWLERTAREHAEFDEILAYHLDRSYALRAELGPLDDATRAIGRRVADLLSDAGDRAADRGDTPAASAMWKRAFDLLPDADPRWPALAAAAGAARFESGEPSPSGSSEIIAEALERAERIGSAEAVAGLAPIGAVYRSVRDPSAIPTREIIELGAACEAVLEDAPAHRRLRGWGRLAVGVAHNWLGQMTQAAGLCERAASDGEAVGDRYLERAALWRGLVVQLLGARPLSDLTDPPDAGSEHTLGIRSMALALAGRPEEARTVAAAAVARARELGLVGAMEHLFSGSIELIVGRPDLAEPFLREAYTRASAGFSASIAGDLARALHELGRDDEALEVLASHPDTAADDYEAVGLQRSAHAAILAARGELAEAERLAREGVAALELTEDLVRHGQTRLALATVLRAAGREDEAVAEALQALALFERKGDIAHAARARGFLGDADGSKS